MGSIRNKRRKTCFNEKNNGKIGKSVKLSRSLKKPGQSQFTAGDKEAVLSLTEELAKKYFLTQNIMKLSNNIKIDSKI